MYSGVESRTIYRINVSGPSVFLTCELEGCPVDNMRGLDVHAIDGLAINLPRPNGAYAETYGVHGATSIGVWDLPEGTIFNNSLEGNGSAFFRFNQYNIDHMEHGGVIEFDPEPSVLDPLGVRSKVFGGGLCMVVTVATSTTGETTEQFDLRYPS